MSREGLNEDFRDLLILLADAEAELIRNKEASGRPKDVADVDRLRRRPAGQDSQAGQ
jgi:hypothetical protein